MFAFSGIRYPIQFCVFYKNDKHSFHFFIQVFNTKKLNRTGLKGFSWYFILVHLQHCYDFLRKLPHPRVSADFTRFYSLPTIGALNSISPSINEVKFDCLSFVFLLSGWLLKITAGFSRCLGLWSVLEFLQVLVVDWLAYNFLYTTF